MRALLAAVTARSHAIASGKVDDTEAATRLYRVVVTRTDAEPTFDRSLGQLVPAASTAVYTGAARITPVDPGQVVDLGETPSYWGDIVVHIDSAGAPPRVDDILTISDDDNGQAVKAGLVNRVFRVGHVEAGGFFPSGYLLHASGVQPSRNTP